MEHVAGNPKLFLQIYFACYDNTLDKLMQLRPSIYYFKRQRDQNRRYYDFVAQELQEIYPDISGRLPEESLV